MNLNKSLFLILALTLAFTPVSHSYFEWCQNYPKLWQRTASYFKSMVNFDLFNWVDQETHLVISGTKGDQPHFEVINRTIDTLAAKNKNSKIKPSLIDIRQELNEQTLKLLSEFTPSNPRDRRLDFLTEDVVRAVLTSIERHPVVSTIKTLNYDQNGVSIGYCFGRATYVDLMLRRLGVDENSIKKIWAIGTMQSLGGTPWQFHVGTMVRLNTGQWIVIDNVVGMPIEAHAWYKRFQSENKAKDLRVFVTDSEKFTPSLGVYSRLQMGLDIPRELDWYKDYFDDLTQWFQDNKDSEKIAQFLRIKKIPDRP